eukprot:1154782-Pelagomonas_calceolata.AAC.7
MSNCTLVGANVLILGCMLALVLVADQLLIRASNPVWLVGGTGVFCVLERHMWLGCAIVGNLQLEGAPVRHVDPCRRSGIFGAGPPLHSRGFLFTECALPACLILFHSSIIVNASDKYSEWTFPACMVWFEVHPGRSRHTAWPEILLGSRVWGMMSH